MARDRIGKYTELVTLWIMPSTNQRLLDLAVSQDRGKSEIIRQLLELALHVIDQEDKKAAK